MSDSFEQFLLSEDDLDESFFGEEPSAAYDPSFLSGDESGKFLVDFVNGLTHGSHPGTVDHASALFTSAVGNVVFHNVTRFSGDSGQQLHEQFLTSLRACARYRMELNDGAQFDVEKLGVDEEDDVTFARWLTTEEPYRLEGLWAVSLKDSVLSFVNTRNPDKSEIRRLAKVALERISKVPQS